MQFDPTLYVITDSTYHTTETLLRAVDEACRGGATLIQLREKDTGGRSYLELAQQVKSEGRKMLPKKQEVFHAARSPW